MIEISLKKLFSKKKDFSLIGELINAIDPDISIEDAKGKILLGVDQNKQESKQAIEVAGQIIGWVNGGEKAATVAAAIAYIANKEFEKKTLANELLDRYRETTLLYDISEKITASLDLKEVAKLVIDEASKLIDASSGSVMLLEPTTEKLEILASFGREYKPKANLKLGKGIIGNVLSTGVGEIVNDVLLDPRFIASQAPIRSLICVPLKSKDRVIGAITMSNSALVNYTAQELKLLTMLASQAASAIENAILHEKKLKESRRDALLFRLANQIRLSLDLDTILETAVSEIRNLLEIDRCQFIWYRCRNDEGINVKNTCFYCPHLADEKDSINNEVDNSETNQILQIWEVVNEAKKPGLTSLIGDYNAQEMGNFNQQLLDREMVRVDRVKSVIDPVGRQFFINRQFTSVLAVPIQTRSGSIGAISLGTIAQERAWSEAEVELLKAVANQLAIALDQAELYKEAATAAATAQAQAQQLQQMLHELQQTQAQLIQSEKMSSLGQLVAGVAHEINNPINFIHGNISYIEQYTEDLLDLLKLYDKHYPEPAAEIEDRIEAMDLEFTIADLAKLTSSMKAGTERIRKIVLSLRNFSRHDQADSKSVNIHEGIDSTLLILQHRLKATAERPEIQVIKQYSNLPLVECYPSQLNQVFMHIISNAIDALEEMMINEKENSNYQLPKILISTEIVDGDSIVIRIRDNGSGIPEAVKTKLFDPFFTTKPVGKGTGLGLSISHSIVVQKHGGILQCDSTPGEGTEFCIQIPILAEIAKSVPAIASQLSY